MSDREELTVLWRPTGPDELELVRAIEVVREFR